MQEGASNQLPPCRHGHLPGGGGDVLGAGGAGWGLEEVQAGQHRVYSLLQAVSKGNDTFTVVRFHSDQF